MNLHSEIYKITFNQFGNNYKLMFKQVDTNVFCEVDIMSYDAKNIALSKENISSSRLKSYDLILSILDSFSIKIDRIIINKKNNIILSKIVLISNNEEIAIESNFIDAIILSLKTFSIILINKSLYDTKQSHLYKQKESVKIVNKNKKDDLNTIIRLKKTLDELIRNESYEHAAVIRDRIKKISKNKEIN
tara:strand:+ start:1460 stop:2029 length:570 start_codon:yes stop_codon:yes gene_type:complete